MFVIDLRNTSCWMNKLCFIEELKELVSLIIMTEFHFSDSKFFSNPFQVWFLFENWVYKRSLVLRNWKIRILTRRWSEQEYWQKNELYLIFCDKFFCKWLNSQKNVYLPLKMFFFGQANKTTTASIWIILRIKSLFKRKVHQSILKSKILPPVLRH